MSDIEFSKFKAQLLERGWSIQDNIDTIEKEVIFYFNNF